MASVTKRGKKWSVRYRTTDETGATVNHRVSFNTKEEAWENARALEQASASGVNVHGEKMTCGTLMEKWFIEHCSSLGASTQSRYSYGIDRLAETFVYDLPVKKLSPSVHTRLLDDLRKGDQSHSPVKLITAKTLTDPLRYSVSWACRNGLILRNPLSNAKIPKIPKREQRILSEKDINDIVMEASRHFKIPILLAAYGGLRRGECAGLKWEDVDFNRGVLTIKRTMIKLKTGQEILKDSPKNDASRRTVTLPKFVMKELSAIPKKGDFVCSSIYGEQYKLLTYASYLSQIIKAINQRRIENNQQPMPKATFHDLRHTHAAMLIKMNIQPKIISERLGHTSIAITMDIYGYLMEGLQAGVADALDAEFQKQEAGNKSGNTGLKVGTKTVVFCRQLKKCKEQKSQ